jgi:hypothetical protein
MKNAALATDPRKRGQTAPAKTRVKSAGMRSGAAVLAELLAFARKHGVRMGGRKPTRTERHGR